MKKSFFIVFVFAAFSALLLFSYIVDKVQAYSQQDCINIAMNCATRCSKSVTAKNIGTVGEACAQNCANEVMAYCRNINNPQPKVQQPQQKVQQQQNSPIRQKAVAPPALTVQKGVYTSHNYSQELIAQLGAKDAGGPYTFSLDTLGGFPPMGLIFKPDGTLEGVPTGKSSKLQACVTDVAGNKACKTLDIAVQKEKTDKPELEVSEPFKLSELPFASLTPGKEIQSGINERVVIKMPDGSLVEMDKNSAITPLSEFEVKSDEGRYRFDYKHKDGGSCGPIGQSPTWACRQVDARDAKLRVKGTEFLVDTDQYGTNITVIKGLLSVSDANGKKTVEVPAGKYTYIKKWGLPSDPESFDSSQVEEWWKEKTPEETKRDIIIGSVAVFLVVLIYILFNRRKHIWPKWFGAPTPKAKSAINPNREGLAVLSFLIGIISVATILNNYIGIVFVPVRILDFISSPTFLMVEIAGLILGIAGFHGSKRGFATFIIMLNIFGIFLSLMPSVMPSIIPSFNSILFKIF